MVYIVVDRGKCDGCKVCIQVCPANVYEMDKENKAEPVRSHDCIEDCSCVDACPPQAIFIDICE